MSTWPSDFPVAIEQSDDFRILNRIAPLAPDLAVRIRPTLDKDRKELDLSFRHFRSRCIEFSRAQIRAVNKLIVQCAEEVVFYRDDQPWVEPFVAKNAGYRIEPRSLGSRLIQIQ